MTAVASAYQSEHASLKELFSLLKPGVMTLVVFSGVVGLLLAPGELHPFLQLLAIFCIALGSGAGAMINMWYDRDIDAIMSRTQKRPIPSGKVQPDDVLAFGILLAIASVGLMGLAINWFAAGTLAFAIFFYAVIYTMWLKRSTPQNIVIGGAAGAFPPVIGWAAMSGSLSVDSMILFAIIFLWTPPHFWALALYKNTDYQTANIPMMPVSKGASHTKSLMVIYCWILFAICVAPLFIGMSGWLYGAIAVGLNLRFLQYAYRVKASDDTTLMRKMFAFSIFYLFLLFSAFLLDHALAPIIAGFSF